MQKLNNALDGAYRKLGLRKSNGKTPSECCFTLKALGLSGVQVKDMQLQDLKHATAKLIEIWNRDQAISAILCISATKGIKVKDKKRNELLCYKMFDVANCTVNRDYPDVFVFTARHKESINCHAFYCSDSIQAEAICLSMSRAFQAAFKAWMKLSEQKNLKCVPENETPVNFDGVNSKGENETSQGEENSGIPLAGKIVKSRRQSTVSNISAYSFNSEADEVFQGLLAVNEEDEGLDDVLLRRTSVDWVEVKKDEEVQLKMLGDEIIWDDDFQC